MRDEIGDGMVVQHRIAFPAVAALALIVLLPAGTAAQEAVKGYAFTPVLHSVSYAGVWRGQAQLTLDQFLVKAKELGFTHVEVMGKRPHLSPLDYDAAARAKLKARLQELGIKIVCLAGYPDFTASADKMGIPSAEMGAIYVGELARLARDLDIPRVPLGIAHRAACSKPRSCMRTCSRRKARPSTRTVLARSS
jgi:sugar phosphate isomerase/epimerase